MLRIEPAGAVLAPGARSSLTGGDGWFRPEAVSHLFTQQLKNRRFAVLACPPQRLRQPPIALLSDSRHSDFCHSVYDINGFFLPTASDPD